MLKYFPRLRLQITRIWSTTEQRLSPPFDARQLRGDATQLRWSIRHRAGGD